MSTFQSKKRLTSADPRLVVERTVSRPGTELTASSIGLVMVTCIWSTGITPLSTPMTTRGKLVSGKTEMGILPARYRPAALSTMMKNRIVVAWRVTQNVWPDVVRDSGKYVTFHLPRCPGKALVVIGRIGSGDLHLGAVVHAVRALGDHLVAGRESAQDLGIVAIA